MARAGLLRDRVTFQRMASTTDDFGNTTGTFSDHFSRNAELIERIGKEEIQGGALADVSTAKLRVRSDTKTKALTAADRVSARGTTWAIRSIVQISAKGDMLELALEKGVAP